METVLVVAERTRGDEIKKLLYPGGYAFIRAESEREARMKILDYQLSLVIVDAMLPGSSAKDISIFAASQEVDTILLLSEELFGHVAGMMMKYGVYTALFSRDSIRQYHGGVFGNKCCEGEDQKCRGEEPQASYASQE